MRRGSIAFLLVLFFAVVAVSLAAEESMMGTWKLNEAKSKIAAGMPKNLTVVYAAAGDSVKATLDGVDGNGKATHSEWTGKLDGKDYPVTGDPSADTRSYKRVNGNTIDVTSKKDGKVTLTAHIVVSADGKTRTVTVKAKDSSGKSVTSIAVYDKQ